MVRTKKGYPEEGELVIATVTKIQYHSVFCDLDEYPGKSGMIHISEIAQGRIRNIHEHLREGKTVVCKVLKIDEGKGHIDLSMRRVTEQQKRLKSSELKQQQVVEKIVAQAAEQTNSEPEEIMKVLESKLGGFENIFESFQQVVDGDLSLEEEGIDKKLSKALDVIVKDRINPRLVTIKGVFEIESWAEDGVGLVRQSFSEMPKGAEVRYAGGGRYTTTVTAPDYKEAEGALKTVRERVESTMADAATVSFERTDKR